MMAWGQAGGFPLFPLAPIKDRPADVTWSSALSPPPPLFPQAVFRGRRCLETGGTPDKSLAAVLADAVSKNKTAADETGARRVLPQLRELLQLYTQASNEIRIWASPHRHGNRRGRGGG